MVKDLPPPKPSPVLYGSPNYTVPGKDLFDKVVGTNFLTALQGRVPGIRIVEYPDDLGTSKLVITMRAGATVGGFQRTALPQPLILVDGVPFDNVNQLSAIPPTQIERVEVINRAANLLGLRGYVGVISVITKGGLRPENAVSETSPDAIRKTINGFAPQLLLGNQRHTFFWQPHLDGTEHVYIPMPKVESGSYHLIVAGLTTAGVSFRVSEMITHWIARNR